jgi:hypothetical protein
MARVIPGNINLPHFEGIDDLAAAGEGSNLEKGLVRIKKWHIGAIGACAI